MPSSNCTRPISSACAEASACSYCECWASMLIFKLCYNMHTVRATSEAVLWMKQYTDFMRKTMLAQFQLGKCIKRSLRQGCGCRFCQCANLPWSWSMPIPTCQSWSPSWTLWQPITGTLLTQMWHQLLLPWWLNGETLMYIPTTFTILCLR